MSRPLSVALVGTWELVSREDHTAAGERRIDPALGADPIALLIYDGSGHFAAQFMKRERTVESAEQPSAPMPASTNNSSARGGYDAYFGDYTVDDATGMVTQTLRGALSPQNVGQTLTRGMTVSGDELTIEIAMTVGDEAITRVLRWRRVG